MSSIIDKLLIPIYIPFDESVKLALRRFLRSLLVGFEIDRIEIVSTSRRFTELALMGKDAKPAINFLRKIFGGEITWDNLVFGEEIPGRVIRVEGEKIYVDIGLKEDDYFKVAVQTSELTRRIYNKPKNISKEQIKAMGVDKYLPVNVVIKEDSPIDNDKREISGSLGRSTIKVLSRWLKSRFDRLIVYGATRSSVLKAIKSSGHLRDILNIERVGFLENAIVCKWGTSAIGLIPEIGNFLPTAKFVAVRPRYLKKQLKNL